MTMKMIVKDDVHNYDSEIKQKHICIIVKEDTEDNEHGCCLTMNLMMKFIIKTTMTIFLQNKNRIRNTQKTIASRKRKHPR